MKYAFTATQAKEMDTHAIRTMGVPSVVLMEKAALSIRSIMKNKITKEHTIVVLCGMGNNGGDGMAVARLLRDDDFSVFVCPVGNPDKMTDETKTQFEILVSYGIGIVKPEAIETADIIVDALFGIGLQRQVREPYAEVIRRANASDNYIYSIDVPSGIDATSGNVLGEAIQADETITMGEMKLGLLLHPGEQYAGHVWVADIGFPRQSIDFVQNAVSIFEQNDVLRLPVRPEYSNKGTFGRILVIAGSETMCGACVLAAKAACTMGAGLVKVITTKENRDVVLTKIPEVIVSDYSALEEELAWADVIIAGPGMGRSERTRKIVATVSKIHDRPVVFDGDALFYCKESLHKNIVLTPHLKEMSRITEQTVTQIQQDLLQTATSWAQKLDCTIVLKDHHTVVSDGKSTYLNISGNQGMACGGSGDVLAGVIGGLLASVKPEFEAARLGVYLHGCAGDYMKEKKGSYAMCASDLIVGLTEVTRNADEKRQKKREVHHGE